MRSLTDMRNELADLVNYKTEAEYQTLTEPEKSSIEVDIFNIEVKIAEAEAEEEARPQEKEFDKYSKWDR